MSDAWLIRITFFLAGVVPFVLAGGLQNDRINDIVSIYRKVQSA